MSLDGSWPAVVNYVCLMPPSKSTEGRRSDVALVATSTRASLSLISLARYRGFTIVLYEFGITFHLTILGFRYMVIHAYHRACCGTLCRFALHLPKQSPRILGSGRASMNKSWQEGGNSTSSVYPGHNNIGLPSSEILRRSSC